MQNINPGLQKQKGQQKSIFSCNVYRTNHESRSFYPTPRTNHFRSISTGNSLWNEPQILYFNEKALKQPRKREIVRECGTQTSKTIIQLAKMDRGEGRMSPDSLTQSPRNDNLFRLHSSMENNCPCSVAHRLSEYSLDGSCQHDGDYLFEPNKDTSRDVLNLLPPGDFLDKPLTLTFLERSKNRKPDFPVREDILKQLRPHPQHISIKSKSFVESYTHPNYIKDAEPAPPPRTLQSKPLRSLRNLEPQDTTASVRRRSSSTCHRQHSNFMCPTASSQIKSKLAEIQSVNSLIPPTRRGRSTSPKPSADQRRFESSRKIPYIDKSKSDVSSATTIVNLTRNPEAMMQKDTYEEDVRSEWPSEEALTMAAPFHNSNIDYTISSAVTKFRDPDWRVSLKGLAEVVELCREVDVDQIFDYMIAINQRLIELLRSPRSHVCRTACQAAGHLFEYIKDTRKPLVISQEFDDIVDLLLFKTADANKFIRQDANLALDCMVTHISSYNSVRALCARGPFHKNHLVRCATVRLLVCAVVIAGPEFILNPNNNEYTRRRIILNMAKFLEDKNLETRKFAERLYKVLCKESRFDVYLKKYLDRDQVLKIKTNLKLIRKK